MSQPVSSHRRKSGDGNKRSKRSAQNAQRSLDNPSAGFAGVPFVQEGFHCRQPLPPWYPTTGHYTKGTLSGDNLPMNQAGPNRKGKVWSTQLLLKRYIPCNLPTIYLYMLYIHIYKLYIYILYIYIYIIYVYTLCLVNSLEPSGGRVGHPLLSASRPCSCKSAAAAASSVARSFSTSLACGYGREP